MKLIIVSRFHKLNQSQSLSGARNLDLIPTPGSIAPDMLIGAGCARSTVCVIISFEQTTRR